MTDDPLVSETEVQEIDCVDSLMKKRRRRRKMMMTKKQKRRKRRRRVGMMQMKEYTRRRQKMKKELQLKWKLKVLMRERRMVRILAMNLIYTLY